MTQLAYTLNPDDCEQITQRLGDELFSQGHSVLKNSWSKQSFQDFLMAWSMERPAFKVEAFRFVDVLPSLKSTPQIMAHLRAYFLRPGVDIPPWIRLPLQVASALPISHALVSWLVVRAVGDMARKFITGQNAESALPSLRRLWDSRRCFTVDILGEAAVAESEALDYQRRYLDLILGLAKETAHWPSQPQNEDTPWGLTPRANVSVKCSSLYSQIDPMAFRFSVDAIKDRLRPLLEAARDHNVFVNLDMEQNDYREIFLTVAEEIFLEPGLRDYPHFGLVIQAYLKNSETDLRRMIRLGAQRGCPITIRLVKGAYWDFEVITALQRGFPIPVFTKKSHSDANYEKLTSLMLDHHEHVHAAFGSHNIRSLSYAMAKAQSLGLPPSAIEIQMLYGMASSFRKAVIEKGYRLREYAPVGEILPGMAYLVRRLLENTSNEGFLKVKYMSAQEAKKLLAKPSLPANTDVQPQLKDTSMTALPHAQGAFFNEPLIDWSQPDQQDWIPKILAKVRSKLPFRINPIISGTAYTASETLTVTNPSNHREVISYLGLASAELATQAVDEAHKASGAWQDFPVSQRADILRRAAECMRRDRRELMALMVLETGKTWREADADVAEAIDFCEYYASEAMSLFEPQSLSRLPGEANTYNYRPRGTTVVIAPWNFPLAILTGMAVGPLVCGNAVILKPAEQSSAMGLALYTILREAGVPSHALQFVPGLGETVGPVLVNHRHTHVITFTGSRAVGLSIMENAAKVVPGQKHIKKVVAELGGKNAILIDDDADLDEAVIGALHSAFGFQGQKCSACSRIILVGTAYDGFVSRFREAMSSMKMGPAHETWAKIGPVIDAEAAQRLREVISRNQDKIIATLPVDAALAAQGHFVSPTVFASTDWQSELAQNEFFGPLVTLFRVDTFEEGLRRMNEVEYALTAGIFTRNPLHLDWAKKKTEAGNMYFNRGITGALVARQPFGGFKLSGVGAKAGGPDYLFQFVEPVTWTENTQRRGFAPELS